jgi:hypothetical protein
MHLSDGTLRRWLDEPLSVDAVKRRHLDACELCRRHVTSVRADADRVEAALAVAPPAVDPAAALVRLQAGFAIAGPPARTRFADMPWRADPRRRARLARWSAAGTCAVALSAALVITGAAQGLFTIFQPRQFSPVPVTSGDIRSLAELATYGDVTGVPTLTVRSASSAAAASAYAGVSILTPANLPATLPAMPRFAVIPGGVVTFTFNAAKAAAAASSRGATLPPMPAGIDGTTLTLTVPPAVIESYGADITSLLSGGPATLTQPALVILEARIPSLSSTGATAAQLEDYLLAQPGIPPDLAAEIRSVGNPSSTLPVPIPINRASAQQVTIAGIPALLIGDSTGIASLALWQRSGVVYAVAGSVTSDQLLAVAGSLR